MPKHVAMWNLTGMFHAPAPVVCNPTGLCPDLRDLMKVPHLMEYYDAGGTAKDCETGCVNDEDTIYELRVQASEPH